MATVELSIVIPAHNRSDLLREAVASVLRQPYPVHEVIIADDGSVDDTAAVCRELRQQATATTVVISRSDENFGPQVARNRGLSLATGEAVMFLDSDDALTDDGLTPLMDALHGDPQLDYVYGQVLKVGADLKPVPGEGPCGGPFGPDPAEIAGYHWAIMGAVYQREYLRQVGPWNEELTGSQDWEFQGRVKIAGGRWRFMNHVVALCRQHTYTRVGTRRFRPDYVGSVEKACLSLKEHAANRGLLTAGLRRRLAWKLCLHALEFSINNCRQERQRLMAEAVEVAEGTGFDEHLIRLAMRAPALLDFAAFSSIKAALNCRSALKTRESGRDEG